MDNMDKLVSVNITTYNRAHLIERCLNSVLGQSYSKIEINVVDDCSTDNTFEIVDKYIQKDKRIKYFRHHKNEGNAKARNTALKMCCGYYVAFMDDDDEWIDQHKIAKQVSVFENKENTNVGIICTSVRLYSDENTYKDKIIERPRNLMRAILKGNSIIYNSTVMTKRSIMMEVGAFDVNLPRGIDSDFYRVCIVMYKYELYIIPKITTSVHEYGSDRITSLNNKNNIYKDYISQIITIKKYKNMWHKHPSVLIYRIIKAIKSYILSK